MNSTWITLPSSEKPDSNRPGKFTTQLAKPIQLDGKYELGLKQISYSKRWHNVASHQNVFYARNNRRIWKFVMEPGFYGTPEYLVQTLNAATEHAKIGDSQIVEFGYNKHSHRLQFTLNKDSTLFVPRGLSYVLGADIDEAESNYYVYDNREGEMDVEHIPRFETLLKSAKPIVFIYGADYTEVSRIAEVAKMSAQDAGVVRIVAAHLLNLGQSKNDDMVRVDLAKELQLETVPRLYVYSSNIEYVPVGSGEAPLLRIVNVEGSHGDTVQKTFDSVIYIPIFSNFIDKLTIKICDERGNVVPFNGETVVVLHVRKV